MLTFPHAGQSNTSLCSCIPLFPSTYLHWEVLHLKFVQKDTQVRNNMFIYIYTSICFEIVISSKLEKALSLLLDTRMGPIYKLDDSKKTTLRRQVASNKAYNKNAFSRDVLKMWFDISRHKFHLKRRPRWGGGWWRKLIGTRYSADYDDADGNVHIQSPYTESLTWSEGLEDLSTQNLELET